MANMIKRFLKDNHLFWKIYTVYIKVQIAFLGEKRWEAKRFKAAQGYELDFDNPCTLNEKMAWLKINYFQPSYYECCDKYLVHGYLKKKLGVDLAPRLIFVTQDPKELTFDNIKEFPCIIKTSNGSGTNLIVKSRDQYSESYIQKLFKKFVILTDLHTVSSREHQYDINPAYIVVESLLSDENGGIPNDYKFFYIKGNLEFVYCSVDRLGANVRHVYDKDWNRLHFAWVANANKQIFEKYDSSASISAPIHFEEMKAISRKLAEDFPMVRIDFYETKDRLYVGEITLQHGSAHDKFYPRDYDMGFGQKVALPEKNR